MTKTAKTILKQALRLNRFERTKLIEALFHSFNKANKDGVDAFWAREAEARLDAYDAEHVSADSADTVFERVNKSYIHWHEEKHRQGYLKHPPQRDYFSTWKNKHAWGDE